MYRADVSSIINLSMVHPHISLIKISQINPNLFFKSKKKCTWHMLLYNDS